MNQSRSCPKSGYRAGARAAAGCGASNSRRVPAESYSETVSIPRNRAFLSTGTTWLLCLGVVGVGRMSRMYFVFKAASLSVRVISGWRQGIRR
eukprot:1394611-Amorphochlora_amoeboformis.AAC.1